METAMIEPIRLCSGQSTCSVDLLKDNTNAFGRRIGKPFSAPTTATICHKNEPAATQFISAYVEDQYTSTAKTSRRASSQVDEKTHPCRDTPCIASMLQETLSISNCMLVHDHLIKTALEQDTYLGSLLITAYGKCGLLIEAHIVLNGMHTCKVIPWTAMITVYAQSGHCKEAMELFVYMRQTGVEPNHVTFLAVLNACIGLETLEDGRFIHACVIDCGLESDVVVGTALVRMYLQSYALEEGSTLFGKLGSRDVVSWTTMITAYVQQNLSRQALELFDLMLQDHVKPSVVTLTSILSACANLADLEEGTRVRTYVVEMKCEDDSAVAGALVNMYSKCGMLEEARSIFNKLQHQDVVSCTTMISAYYREGHLMEALDLFYEMCYGGVKLNRATFVTVLSVCADMQSITHGHSIHSCLVKVGLAPEIMLENALLHMYAKTGGLVDACDVFEKMFEHDVISWTAVLTAYANHGYEKQALELYHVMPQNDIISNIAIFVTILGVCASMLALGQGRSVHADIIEKGIKLDGILATSLVEMYGKCGSRDDAHSVFRRMCKRDTIAWTSIITVYAQEGYAKEAIELFEQMRLDEVKPDAVTFISLLSGCSNACMVDEGRTFFNSMAEDYGVSPSVEHYGCMVDMLGRAGYLEAAESFIMKSPYPSNVCMWSSLLGACRMYGDISRATHCAEQLMVLEPQNAAPFVLISSIHAAQGSWAEAQLVQQNMVNKGLKKKPGCTWIEVDNKIHEFVASDGGHPEREAIYEMLNNLECQLKEAGYMPNTKLVLHDVDEGLKVHLLGRHSERLAVAFGLIKTPPGTPLRLAKNLKTCPNCHSAMKPISKLVGREIILRDTSRMHHFENGSCSCGDYW